MPNGSCLAWIVFVKYINASKEEGGIAITQAKPILVP
jgi:hypothetical protein